MNLLPVALFQTTDLQPWHYAVAGCGVLLLLAIILYFIPGGRINVSGSAACALVSLVVGFGIGIATMMALGYHWEGEPTPKSAAGGGMGGRMGGMGGMGGGASGKGEGGGGPGRGKGEDGGGKNGASEKKDKNTDSNGDSDKKGKEEKG